MKLIPVILFAGIFSFSAQSSKDPIGTNLIPELAKMKPDTNQVIFVLKRIWEIKYQKPNESISYILENIQLAKKLNFYKGVAESYKLYGVLLDETGQISKSIEAYRTAQSFYKKINDELGVAKCIGNIGMLYRDQRRHDESIELFKQIIPVFKKHEFHIGSYTSHLNICIELTLTDRLKEAKYHIKQAEKYMRLAQIEDPNYYGNLGNIYLQDKSYQQAINYFEKAIQLEPDGHGVSTWLDNIGRCYNSLGMRKQAILYIEKAIESYPQIYNANSYSAHRNLASSYYAERRLDEAYKTLSTALEIRDSIFSITNAEQLSELSKKYETEKKALQIKALKNERKIQDQVIKSETRQKVIFGTGMVLFLILGVFLFKLVHRKKKDNQIISEQKALVELQKDDLIVKNQEILDSITYAKRLQDAILPAESYWKTHLPESFILYKPKDIVAGDFYWMEHQFIELDGVKEEVLFFAAADCTGHGVPGALVSVICCNALNRSVLEFHFTEPGKILDKTRELVIDTFKRSTEDVKDGMDISLGCFIISSRKLLWAGANNPLWIITGNTSELIEWKPQKEPIGLYDRLTNFQTHEMILSPDTSLYLFTDGFADQFGGQNGKKFKYKNFKDELIRINPLPMEEQFEHLNDLIENWRGKLEQIDDICVIGIRL